MSKRIVDIPDRTYDFIMGLNQHTFGSKYAHKDVQADIVKAVKESKPYDEADRWIPVSERLPEKKGWYEATFISVTGARTVGLAFYSDRVEDFAVDGVIAWKPLPKPYESEDE